VPAGLASAMTEATCGGGKRLRGILVLATSRCCGGEESAALPLACAVELLHTASLVHDDLPAMDDHDSRRGRPSLHLRHGEAMAILAGDALISAAFEVAAESRPRCGLAPVIRSLARAAGARGMAAGQALDLAPPTDPVGDADHFRTTYELKTASLFRTAAEIGSLCAGAATEEVSALAHFGTKLGLAFQVVDDLLDADADHAALHPSLVTSRGTRSAHLCAQRWIEEAKESLAGFGDRAWALHGMADLVLRRKG
jgi:geranylgeranyl pyrophosphate synthase